MTNPTINNPLQLLSGGNISRVDLKDIKLNLPGKTIYQHKEKLHN